MSPTSSSRAACWRTASPACAAARAHTSTSSPSRARRATSAPAATPSALALWTLWLEDWLLAPGVPPRQVALTISKRLLAWCLYCRQLLGDSARVAARTVTAAVRAMTAEPTLAVGIVGCIQMHGSLANWHTHIPSGTTPWRERDAGCGIAEPPKRRFPDIEILAEGMDKVDHGTQEVAPIGGATGTMECIEFAIMDRSRMTARIVPLGSDEVGDARMGGTVTQRVAAVAELTAQAWKLAGRPLPTCTRATIPVVTGTLKDHAGST